MNRLQEFEELKVWSEQPPPALDHSVFRVRKRVRRRHLRTAFLTIVTGLCAFFVICVNAFPTFALTCARIPFLQELTAAVVFSPSLSAAVSHNYIQYVGQEQTIDNTKLRIESLIADQQQMVIFYRTSGNAFAYRVSCQLIDKNGNTLSGYAVTSGDEKDQLKKFEIHFTDMDLPETLYLRIRLCAVEADGSSQWLDSVFSFEIQIDPQRTATSKILSICRWIELDGQKLLVEELELSPTRTTLRLSDDPENTAWLKDLSFSFVGQDGKTFESVDSTVTSVGNTDGNGFYTYYFESLYYVPNPEALTLQIHDAVWLDKNTPSVLLQKKEGFTSEDLPPAILSVSVEKDGTGINAQFVIRAESLLPASPFQSQYSDSLGIVHSFSGYSFSSTGSPDTSPYIFTYFPESPDWEIIELQPAYSWYSSPEDPLHIPLS